jgi:G3E family GTPase
MPAIRFILLGGFLGSGKTTTIARLARAYQDRGLRVAIVTNDHASELVDTLSLRSQGFHVGEIPGACFCGNVEELTTAVERLGTLIQPDVVLVEPVGSCTDLVASVIRPLRRLFAARFDVAPYGVLLKPSHGAKILRGTPGGFSPQAAYIFRQQIAEADFVAINRIDQLRPAEVDELERLLGEQYPGTPVLRMSAKSGQGLPALLEFLEQRGDFGSRVLDLDYEQYAAGEADLGWLNGAFLIRGKRPFNLDRLLLALVGELRGSLAASGAETAHLKAIGLSEGAYGVVNLIDSDSPAELSLPAARQVSKAHLIVNARVAAGPALLESHLAAALHHACETLGLTVADRHVQSFRPGKMAPPPAIGTPLAG